MNARVNSGRDGIAAKVVVVALTVVGCGSTGTLVPTGGDGGSVDGSTLVDGGVVGEGGSDVCTDGDQCAVLLASSCCGYCSAPPTGAWHPYVVPNPPKLASETCDTSCTDCTIPVRVDRWATAVCTSRVCALLDLSKSDLSACTDDRDCIVRGEDACGLDAKRPIALAASQVTAYADLKGSGTKDCAAIAVVFAEKAVCFEKHCAIAR
ncbi:MAG: hypothetical protein U0169_21875 [Polyangiaceae bacterium]